MVSRSRSVAMLGGVALALTGCASFQAKPLVPREVLLELQAVRLEALRPTEARPAPPEVDRPAFDLTDGLSADEAVAAALVLNPDLRAFRRERGVAEGELIAAGLLPNPELAVGWSFIENVTRSFLTSGFEIGINWAPPRPGERGAKTARAQARIEEVRAQTASEEWRVAADVRKAYVALVAAGRRRDLVDTSLALQQRARGVLRERLWLGDVSRLEATLLDLELADRLREQAAIANEYERARQALNRLLGLPPRLAVPLQAGPGLLAVRPVALPPAALETAMIGRRPDLAAAREAYEQDERSLQLAYIQRIPWFTFGPMYPGASGFKAQQVTGLPVLQITVDPDRTARYGVNAAEVMTAVETLGGTEATQVIEGQRRFPLVLRFPDDVRRDRDSIARVLVSAPGGERVPLGALTRIEEGEGPAEISHVNGSG